MLHSKASKIAIVAAVCLLSVGTMVGLSIRPAHASSVTNTPIPGVVTLYYWGPYSTQSYGLVFTVPGSSGHKE
jgi:hypothetical protein